MVVYSAIFFFGTFLITGCQNQSFFAIFICLVLVFWWYFLALLPVLGPFLANWPSPLYHCSCNSFNHCFWDDLSSSHIFELQQELQQENFDNVYLENNCYHHNIHPLWSIWPWWNPVPLEKISYFWIWNILSNVKCTVYSGIFRKIWLDWWNFHPWYLSTFENQCSHNSLRIIFWIYFQQI